MTTIPDPSANLLHLKGRDRNLAPFGWTPKQAEWIALACLHSGSFLRSQLTAYLQYPPSTAGRFIRSLVTNRHATELSLPLPGLPLLCRLSNKAIYRHLGAANIRYRRPASPRITYTRMLALDYILENAQHLWLPTEDDKVAFFHNTLSIPKNDLPSRVYQGHAGGRRRYFVDKFPISISPETVTMVYIDSGYPTDRPFRRWISEHRKFLSLIAEVGYQPHIVFLTTNRLIIPVVEKLLTTYMTQGTIIPSSAVAIQEEIATIRAAVSKGDIPTINTFGGLNKAMDRRFELEDQYTAMLEQSNKPLFSSYSVWHSERLDHIEFAHLDQYEFQPAEQLQA